VVDLGGAARKTFGGRKRIVPYLRQKKRKRRATAKGQGTSSFRARGGKRCFGPRIGLHKAAAIHDRGMSAGNRYWEKGKDGRKKTEEKIGDDS